MHDRKLQVFACTATKKTTTTNMTTQFLVIRAKGLSSAGVWMYFCVTEFMFYSYRDISTKANTQFVLILGGNQLRFFFFKL